MARWKRRSSCRSERSPRQGISNEMLEQLKPRIISRILSSLLPARDGKAGPPTWRGAPPSCSCGARCSLIPRFQVFQLKRAAQSHRGRRELFARTSTVPTLSFSESATAAQIASGRHHLAFDEMHRVSSRRHPRPSFHGNDPALGRSLEELFEAK